MSTIWSWERNSHAPAMSPMIGLVSKILLNSSRRPSLLLLFCITLFIASKIGPEVMIFRGGRSFTPGTKAVEKMYILRPETVESYFYMWRATHDPMYQEWGWSAVQAIEKHCRTDNGYTGLKNVFDAHPPKDNVQQSFFLAETLKYLYLLFSDDSDISLREYVFNTEAHPFPHIKGIPTETTQR